MRYMPLCGMRTALIFPSKWYEPFGLVAIEAFATGTPVIAANIGAIAELVDAHRTGLLFEPSDPQSLSAKSTRCWRLYQIRCHKCVRTADRSMSQNIQQTRITKGCLRFISR